jgi:DNA-binding transcriptional ArsR family regulator
VKTYELAIEALSDKTRREVLTRLRESPASVAEIAAGMPVSRPAVSQHLKVLRDSGLVAYETVGTRNVYRVDVDGLAALRKWLDEFWTVALDRYARFVAEETTQQTKKDHR